MYGILKKFPQVKTCCCQWSLETGCNVLGWIHFMSSIFIFVMTFAFCNMLFATWRSADEQEEATAIMFALVLSGMITAAVGIDVLLAVLLLYAVNKIDLGLLKIWLYMEISLFLMNCTLRLINFIGLLGLKAPTSELYGNVVQNMLEISYIFYFITIVKSFYFEKTGLAHYESPGDDECSDSYGAEEQEEPEEPEQHEEPPCDDRR